MASASPQIKPRVALLVITLRTGGIERQYVRLANEFIKQGLEVDLVAYEAEGEFKSLLDPAVNLIGLTGSHATWKNVLPLVRYLRARKPEAILGGHDLANAGMVLAKKLAGVKTRTVVLAHTTLSVRYTQNPNFKARMRGVFIRIFFQRADQVCAVSAGAAQDLAQFLGVDQSKVEVAYIGTVDDDFRAQAKRPPSHAWLIQKDSPVVVSVGRLSPEKNFELLLEAVQKVQVKQKVRVIIFGEGPERANLESKVQSLGLTEVAALPGFSPHPAAELSQADCFVLSSTREGLPTALIEALAVGIPVVATNCPSGPDEILEGGKWGMLIPMNDADAMAKAILASIAGGKGPGEVAVKRFLVSECAARLRSILLKGIES